MYFCRVRVAPNQLQHFAKQFQCKRVAVPSVKTASLASSCYF